MAKHWHFKARIKSKLYLKQKRFGHYFCGSAKITHFALFLYNINWTLVFVVQIVPTRLISPNCHYAEGVHLRRSPPHTPELIMQLWFCLFAYEDFCALNLSVMMKALQMPLSEIRQDLYRLYDNNASGLELWRHNLRDLDMKTHSSCQRLGCH